MDDGPEREILRATYRALCKHGYADLTLKEIAAESDRSKALIHYYYDGKHGLFDAFLELLYEEYTDRIDAATGDTAGERLRSLLAVLLTDEGASSGREFRTALLEVKAQAPYNDTIREHLVEFDAALFERLETVVADGVESDEFDPSVDPARVAECLTATVQGAHARRVAIDDSTDELYETLVDHAERHLLADGTGSLEVGR